MENNKKIKFSNKLEKISRKAFYGCEKVTRLPDMTCVESVGEKAFLECKVTNSFNKKEWEK